VGEAVKGALLLVEDKTLTTNICTRTTLEEKVPDLLDEIIRVIGEPKEPLVMSKNKE
jgi:hypothetical protein